MPNKKEHTYKVKRSIPRGKFYTYYILFVLIAPKIALGQEVLIKEYQKTLLTYPYSDPNPVPSIALDQDINRFYPYYYFDGYTDQGEEKSWKVVQMENPFIEVSVFPEVGGKVWGAHEKSTGDAFVYDNSVVKFRAIGIRGPWTSGGIEHNFGLDIGHAPWAAGKVDYLTTTEDTYLSTYVGGLDLASRTRWSVEIRLPKDGAYFETNSTWTNPRPISQSYFSWENAAFKASDDLRFYFPGNHHIGHSGEASKWPISDDGKDLSYYRNNGFGGHKSYHVLGTLSEWFGGYWEDQQLGFGHLAPYDEAPGKKIWLWSQARSGGLWEDLLTDSDGQYIEAQSGKKFNQALSDSGDGTPFNQKMFGPLYTDLKNEVWLPIKKTGRIDAISDFGTLALINKDSGLHIVFNPITSIEREIRVMVNDSLRYTKQLNLSPMENFETTIASVDHTKVTNRTKILLGQDLLFDSTTVNAEFERPLISPENSSPTSAEYYFQRAEDANAVRSYEEAISYYNKTLDKASDHHQALTQMAELYLRLGQWDKALQYVRQVLALNTYDGAANFVMGTILFEKGEWDQAIESYGIASAMMEYRSASYLQIAIVYLKKGAFEKAIDYALKSLRYDANNYRAMELLITLYRKTDQTEKCKVLVESVLKRDPLNPYVRFENTLINSDQGLYKKFHDLYQNEMPQETFLELAITYANQGNIVEALMVLEQAPSHPMVHYWKAYLLTGSDTGASKQELAMAIESSPYLVFPFRVESIPVLKWALSKMPSWKTGYYLGLIHWSKLQLDKALELFNGIGDTSDFASFYISRGLLKRKLGIDHDSVQGDLNKAVEIAPKEWRTWYFSIKGSYEEGHLEIAREKAKIAHRKFVDNSVVSILYAKVLNALGKYTEAIKVLSNILVLPKEGAEEAHIQFEIAHIGEALESIRNKQWSEAVELLNESKKWPENLGAGKPYRYDYRFQDYLIRYVLDKLGNATLAKKAGEDILSYRKSREQLWELNTFGTFFEYQILKELGMDEELRLLKADLTKIQEKEAVSHSGTAGPLSKIEWLNSKINNAPEDKDMGRYEQFSKSNFPNKDILFFKALDIIEKSNGT